MNLGSPKLIENTPLTFPSHLRAAAEELELTVRAALYEEDDNHRGGLCLEIYQFPDELDPILNEEVDTIGEAKEMLRALVASDLEDMV
jgi:hypothetical protein